ncbi:hypothetical protein ABFS82_02G162700 [Erythranthe guttata]|uniref:zinc finger CCCH domain-containing protein 12-like n=1 Tax=Erythranthe guttata TaxID=4155 RepID=UPI00064DB555|nr:PREDICTED: zinc finger CCCH domain-containing protein 12-like [Erythranthe guttata]XP_012843724.1 PREDICTED: zinc finger CCCH domain-containing protein 12-like [Erythranthe guttata]XP_012843725.1 PREDICTED: zinc finger CCCH domain-containing protein 12-like [Erythranthe guttata]|eukprot:XP_012843723.1 PREDICTED: zinc finger CCCH domain-containing protein 12-like [Erythranthe guttata]
MMDCNQGSGFADGNVVQFESGNLENDVNENPCLGSIDRAVSAIEDGIQNRETSVDINPMSNQEGTLSQFGVGSEPQNKRPRSSLMVDLMASDRSKVIKMLYKTKLCKFRNGNCLAKNCNYAHSSEELREPPKWQEIFAEPPKEEDLELSETREVFPIPVVELSGETQGISMRQYCLNYYTEEGCLYGENCNFIHEEHDRESVAICLLPGNDCVSEEGNVSKPIVRFANWRTRLCTKWERTGCCTFGSECHFAHGTAELQRYGGGPVYGAVNDSPVLAAKASARRRLPNLIHKTGEIPSRKWSGPEKISKIYGDWIDDLQ